MQRYAWIADKVHRRSVAREAARSVLPNATEVKIVVSGTPPRVAHDARAAHRRGAAELEIPAQAVACLRVLRREAPALFADSRFISPTTNTTPRASRTTKCDARRLQKNSVFFAYCASLRWSFIVYSTTRFDSQTARAAFFVGGYRDTWRIGLAYTKNPIPRPTQSQTVPVTRSRNGTILDHRCRWSRLSVSSAASSDSKADQFFSAKRRPRSPRSRLTWPKASRPEPRSARPAICEIP